MSVASEQSSVQYPGNGSTSTAYQYPYYFFDPMDLAVELRAANGGTVGISSISAMDLIVTVTTSAEHDLTVGDEISIRSVTTDEYNKEFVNVAHVISSTQFQYVLALTPPSSGVVGYGVVVKKPSGEVTTLTLGSDYTVEGTLTSQGYVDGADIKTPHQAYGSDYLLTIYRNISAVQPLVYPENARFPAKSHERGLDRLTMLCQQMLRMVKRSFAVRASDNDLAPFAATENSVVGFNENKQVRTYSLSELQTFLSLDPSPVVGMPMKTFADAGERALAVPEFTGQLGTQRDTGQIYISTALSAGDWSEFQIGSGSVPNSMITNAMLADASVKSNNLAPDSVHGQSEETTAADTMELLVRLSGGTLARITRANFSTQPINSYSNLRISYVTAATFTIDLDEIVLTNGTNQIKFSAPSSITVDITASGANGLDTENEAIGTWYYVWVISNGTDLKGLLSTSSTAPTMPGSYTYKFRIGVVRNDGSGNFIPFRQYGNRVSLVPQLVFTDQVGVTSYTSHVIASSVPSVAVRVNGVCGLSTNAGGAFYIAADSSGLGMSGGAFGNGSGGPYNSFGPSTYFDIPIITPQTVYWLADGTTANKRLVITGYTLNM